MGSGLSVLTSLADDNSTSPGECRHLYCEKWGPNQYYCCDCRDFVKDESLMRDEDLKIESIVDESVPEDGIDRGVTIEFLVNFANACKCWDMTTREVRRRFVMPATRESRCRFVELPAMSEVVGRAVTFVSHTWGAKFGDLVAAVSDGNADPQRRVWVDIFAVRQWSSKKPDLDFSAVVRQCSTFLIVCRPQDEVIYLERNDVALRRVEVIPPHVRAQVAFLRVWCLVEIHSAISNNVCIIMKCGNHDRSDDRVAFTAGHNMLLKLYMLIDIETAEATVASDKERILNGIRESKGGVGFVNDTIRGVLVGSFEAGDYPLIQTAVCGDEGPLTELLSDPTQYVVGVAGCGYVGLLRKLIDAGADLKVETNGMSALLAAAAGGHIECLTLLIKLGGDVNREPSGGGLFALGLAAMGGHFACVKFLVENGANINAGADMSALMAAAMGGHNNILEYLIERGGDVNARGDGGMTALTLAASMGLITTVQLLLKHGADKTKTVLGKTAFDLAQEGGHVACEELLQVPLQLPSHLNYLID